VFRSRLYSQCGPGPRFKTAKNLMLILFIKIIKLTEVNRIDPKQQLYETYLKMLTLFLFSCRKSSTRVSKYWMVWSFEMWPVTQHLNPRHGLLKPTVRPDLEGINFPWSHDCPESSGLMDKMGTFLKFA
jgi:hypothetical protein